MATMNISLPDSLKDFVETQVRESGYGTSSEFMRDLIRRESARTRLRAGLDEAYFDQFRERARNSEDVTA